MLIIVYRLKIRPHQFENPSSAHVQKEPLVFTLWHVIFTTCISCICIPEFSKVNNCSYTRTCLRTWPDQEITANVVWPFYLQNYNQRECKYAISTSARTSRELIKD